MSPRQTANHWPGNWRRLGCRSQLHLSGAARLLAAAASSASWRSRKPKVFPAGWCRNWKTGFPGFDQDLKLHVTGCPNSCGQHWIADIGIEGKKLKVDGRMVDAYYFCLGGAVGLNQAIARLTGYRCTADEVPDAIERLLRAYLAEPGCGRKSAPVLCSPQRN